VALTVIETLKQEKLPARAKLLGARILSGFKKSLAGLAGVKDIRGRGLMLAIELDRPCQEMLSLALEQGLLINVTADSVIRLLPPLILSDDQADQLVRELSEIIRVYLAREKP
jgi:acetylornithine aminotransferase